MTSTDALYAELKPDIHALATPLFDFSELCIRKRGNFLPHGAVLTEDGEVRLVTGAPDTKSDTCTSTDVLPVLHDGLRGEASSNSLLAIGIAENVTITLEGKRQTQAVKVLFEHKRGLTVALYLPFERKLFRGYSFGEVFSVAANPEVNPW